MQWKAKCLDVALPAEKHFPILSFSCIWQSLDQQVIEVNVRSLLSRSGRKLPSGRCKLQESTISSVFRSRGLFSSVQSTRNPPDSQHSPQGESRPVKHPAHFRLQQSFLDASACSLLLRNSTIPSKEVINALPTSQVPH